MSKLQTFLKLAETIPSHTVDYLDGEVIDLFIHPFSSDGDTITTAAKERIAYKEVYIDTEYHDKYGHIVHLWLFDGKPVGFVSGTGRWLSNRTCYIVDPGMFETFKHFLMDNLQRDTNPKFLPVVVTDEFFDSEESWIQHLTNEQTFPFKQRSW